MAYVIAEPCIGTKDTACVDACPVDCIHPKKDTTYDDGRPAFDTVPQLYIDPVECIDCGACVPVCPVSAIFALDDLPDGGAYHFAETIRSIRNLDPEIVIEVLTPDFNGKETALRLVLEAEPDIYNHNLETVERLTPVVRSRAKYRLSLEVLRRAKELDADVVTKSGIMLGLGETETELFQALDDLREAQVQVLTLGQYLRPTPEHLPVLEYIRPEQFDLYKQIAEQKGFEYVASGPLVRSSYHAADYKPKRR